MEADIGASSPAGSAEASGGAALEDSVGSEYGEERRRVATVYDAVAGKLSNKDQRYQEGGELAWGAQTKHSTREAPYAPDEVLFQRQGAPQRYAEYDIYYSHERDLPSGGRGVLPESDLLKAIHSYSSHYYEASRRRDGDSDRRRINERSMDETALLAFGILLEEAGREMLGRRGDLVFTEAAGPSVNSDGGSTAQAESAVAVGNQEIGPHVPARKRRRVKGSRASSPQSTVVKGEE